VRFEGGLFADDGTVRSIATSVTSAGAGARLNRKDLLIAPHEDGVNKFHSKAGKHYLGSRVKRQEDLAFLKSGKGCSYVLDPINGTIPSWGVCEVTLRAYNDMPGVYDDEVVVEVLGTVDGTDELMRGSDGEPVVTHRFAMPLKMTVTGCPLVIEQTTLGMSFVRDTSLLNKEPAADAGSEAGEPEDAAAAAAANDDDEDAVAAADGDGEVPVPGGEVAADAADAPEAGGSAGGQALLLMGKACVGSAPLEREFRIKNDGCKPGKIKWKVRASYPGQKTTGTKLDLTVGDDGRVRPKIQFWEDVLRSAPFTVEPKSAIIMPYSSQDFHVTLTRTDVLGKIRAIFTGTVVIEDEASLRKKVRAEVFIKQPAFFARLYTARVG